MKRNAFEVFDQAARARNSHLLSGNPTSAKMPLLWIRGATDMMERGNFVEISVGKLVVAGDDTFEVGSRLYQIVKEAAVEARVSSVSQALENKFMLEITFPAHFKRVPLQNSGSIQTLNISVDLKTLDEAGLQSFLNAVAKKGMNAADDIFTE